ncbi:MAG: CRISPR-associated endoribonuclease Cas6 [Melioribacteraceae bacterium]
MRLTFDFEISPAEIPKNYRIGFISLIKKLIEKQNPSLFGLYYNQHKLKPFTFGVYFPQLQKSNNENFNVGNIAVLNFSTSSFELAAYVYNGFMKLKEQKEKHIWKREGYEIYFKPKRVYMHPIRKIRNDEIEVKTLSPLLVNNLGDSNKFLLPGEEGFLEGLQFSVRECAKEFLNIDYDFPFEFIPEKWGREVVYHYQKTPAVIGTFRIKSIPEILQMIYDAGLGVHRSQGFGLLEVIKQ